MLAPALGGNRGHRALDQLEQGLLHALAGHVPGDGGVFRAARNLVDFVDVDDAVPGLVHVVIALLQQLLDDVFHVLADVAGFGQRGGVRDHEGHVEQACQGLGQQGLAGTGGADEQDVALGQFHFVFLAAAGLAQALVVVVNRHRQGPLGLALADDVLIQDGANLLGRGQLFAGFLLGILAHVLADDVDAQVHALVADEHRGAGDELAHLMLAFAAEGAVEKFVVALLVRHVAVLSQYPII